MAITLSPAVAELLKRAAGDRDVEAFLADLLAGRLDPPERVELYLRLHEKYLREAEELYRGGDLVQAGERYWGAVTALLNALAKKRGEPHYSHRDYAVLIDRLYRETKDRELVTAFAMAERLHANFYRNFLSPEGFEVHRESALRLVEKLKKLAET
ncbi:PaREP1/PaREP8 domain containing family protein [Pyrobaculum islandicum DSM 4184]|uniref:PaREP1/PaREP8 domain containing family protein n=1 Tax=Pyrobaculum islandicum (strain DSM 4184 / JCM 9189 / GEO3) TaxID=384616 RepID=A1RQP8_PYRIL|nr:PaREP1 family protein [Pyrobaculum islandicum]ABL87280.1 PaREP1/PaREP8 domain containing family protein [Pyrobaculum islandicum DSM 4184]